ncbi:MAG: type III secretion system chaperone [Candidatus Methylacidiphilales bacterium]|nr:type III secretion system chaperone [Candidatus Methylacidiphilales bacterium]
MSRANLDALLVKCGRDLDVDLSLGEEGDTMVQVDGNIDITISHNAEEGAVVVCATCGALPDEPEAKMLLLVEMLEANFNWAGTGGATLAVNGTENLIHIQFKESTEMLDEERLQTILRTIVHNAELWHGRLEAGSWESARNARQEARNAEGTDGSSNGFGTDDSVPPDMIRI